MMSTNLRCVDGASPNYDSLRAEVSSTFPQAQARDLPFSSVPLWLSNFLKAATAFPDVLLVGPVASCEKDTHLQSWTLFMDKRIVHTVLLRMQATCAPSMSWEDAVSLGEIGISRDVLDLGYAFASIYPPFGRFTQHHRTAIHHGISEIYDKLNGCRNMMAADDMMSSLPPFEKMTFLKFGGEIWRQKLFDARFVSAMKSQTEYIIGGAVDASCYSGFHGGYIG